MMLFPSKTSQYTEPAWLVQQIGDLEKDCVLLVLLAYSLENLILSKKG